MHVTEVTDRGEVVAEVARTLDKKITPGKMILLLRPLGTTTAQMKSIPDLVAIEKGPAPISEPAQQLNEDDRGSEERAASNLSKIGLGLLQFESTYHQLPPASLVGPDGKAWHSWRVLIWPYVLDSDKDVSFRNYKYDEPWDGPNNKKLLAAMPSAYSYNSAGEKGDTLTRFCCRHRAWYRVLRQRLSV